MHRASDLGLRFCLRPKGSVLVPDASCLLRGLAREQRNPLRRSDATSKGGLGSAPGGHLSRKLRRAADVTAATSKHASPRQRQLNTVSGFTTRGEPRQPLNHRQAIIQNRRSALPSRGCGCLRCRMCLGVQNFARRLTLQNQQLLPQAEILGDQPHPRPKRGRDRPAVHFLGSAVIWTHNFVAGESEVSGVALRDKWIHLAPEATLTSLWGTSVVFFRHQLAVYAGLSSRSM
jgi:hypothetical protein